jgi:hypothetical protein
MIIRKGNDRNKWIDAGESQVRVEPRGVGGARVTGEPGPAEAHRVQVAEHRRRERAA